MGACQAKECYTQAVIWPYLAGSKSDIAGGAVALAEPALNAPEVWKGSVNTSVFIHTGVSTPLTLNC